MSGTGRTLRVAIVGVRVQEPRRYHVSVQVLPSSGLPAGVAVGTDAGWATRPDQVARTETSELSRTPEFACSSFVLRLPQPLANSAGEQPLLRVDLFAAPAAAAGGGGAGVPGAGALDELVGSGSVAARGDAAARLLRGERVMVPVALGEPGGGAGAGGGMLASYDDLGNMGVGSLGGLDGMGSFGGGFGGLGGGVGSMGGGGALGGMGLGMGGVGLMSRSREVLLELLLLDAALVLPRDAFALRANYAGALGAPGGGAAGGGGGSLVRRGGGSGECSLLLLVSRADNLPLVLGDTGVEVEPDTFVALKTLRDGRSSMAAQALTRVAARSCSPVWNQVLTLRVPEGEVHREQVLIAIVNNANSRLMIKASLPLGALVPYKHYNLRLAMPGGPLGSAVHLYVTAVLTDCPRLQQRHLRNHMVDARQLLQARLASASAPLCSLAGSPHDAMSGGEVFGVWRVLDGAAPGAAPAPGCSPLSPPTLLDADPYTTLDAGDEAATAATLHALADEHAARVKACGGSGGSVPEIVPLQCGGGPGGDPEQLLWPPGHMVSLLYGTPPSAASAAPVLQLAVYQLGGPTRGAGVGPAAQNAPAGKVAAVAAAAAAGAVAPAAIAGGAGVGAGAAAGGIGSGTAGVADGVGDAAEAAATGAAVAQGSAANSGAPPPGPSAPVAGSADESGAQPRPAGPVAEGTEDGEVPAPDPAAAAPLASPAGSLRSTSLPLAVAPPPARPSSGGGSVGVRSSTHLDRIMAKYGQAPEHVMLSNATAVAAADVGPPVVSSAVVPPSTSQRATVAVAAAPPDAVGSVVYVPAGLRAAVQGKATTGLRRELVLVGLAAAPLPPRPAAHLTSGGPGEVQLVDGVEVVPAGAAAVAGRRGMAVVVAMEVRRRDTAAVVSALENEFPDDPRSSVGGAGAAAGGGGWWGDSLSMVAWQEGAAAGGLGGTAGGGPGGAAASVVEALVDDCILKQVAVARLVRAAEAASAQMEMASWRGADVENRSRSLAEDNAKLRQLLHEEKQAWRIPQLLPDAATLSRDELIERCEAAMAGYGRERRRNAELVHRLQQLHGEQVDTVELKKRYQQLQEAHMEQARAQTALEGLDARAAQMRATLRTQEDVIRNLEALLTHAVAKAKHAEREAQQERSAHADAERLQQQLQQLAEQRDEQAWAVQQAEEEAKAAKEALQQLEARNAALEQQQGQQQQDQALGASGKREATPPPPASAKAPGEEAQAPAPALDPAPDPELQRQLEEAQARNQELEEQLEAAKADLQAAATAREKELQAELEEAQRKLAEAEGQLAEARERVAALEAQLAELQEKLRDKEAQAEGQREGQGGQQEEKKEPAKHEDEPKKAEGSEDLEAAVAQLTEEKTAAILRAELAESAAEAAQGELIESTKKFAREIAELKTRLAEKDAQLMGGFGDLEALRRGELPPPDLSMPLWGNGGGGGGGPDGQSNGNRHGVSTPPGMIMPNHQPPVPLRPTGSPGTGAGRGGAGRAGSAGSGGLLPPIRGSSSRDSTRPSPPAPAGKPGRAAPPEPRRTSQDRQQPAPLQRAPELPRKGGAGGGGKAGKQAQGKQPAARRAQQQAQQDEEDADDDDEDDDEDDEDEDEEDDGPAPPARGVAARGPVQRRQ